MPLRLHGGRSLSHKDVAGAWSRQSLGGARWFSIAPSLSATQMLDLCLHDGHNVYTGDQAPKQRRHYVG